MSKKKIKLDYPINPDCLTLFYNVIANCGKTPVECSVMIEYSVPDNGDQTTVYQSDITGNCLEALPDGYEQGELQAQLEAEAMGFVPLSIKCTPTFKDSLKPADNAYTNQAQINLKLLSEIHGVLCEQLTDDFKENEDIINILDNIERQLKVVGMAYNRF